MSLSCRTDYQREVTSAVGVEPYKLEPIHIPIGLDELIDVPIFHPPRRHCKLVVMHCHPQ